MRALEPCPPTSIAPRWPASNFFSRCRAPANIVVPTPDYPLDTIAAAFLTPPPPVVCHDVRRDPYLPDPRLYREQTVACEPDNP